MKKMKKMKKKMKKVKKMKNIEEDEEYKSCPVREAPLHKMPHLFGHCPSIGCTPHSEPIAQSEPGPGHNLIGVPAVDYVSRIIVL